MRGCRGMIRSSRAGGSRRAGRIAPQEFLDRYTAQLDDLDPQQVVDELREIGSNITLLCNERAQDVHEGRSWCHRHLVAKWLEDTLDIVIVEVGWPGLDRFAHLRERGILVPRWR